MILCGWKVFYLLSHVSEHPPHLTDCSVRRSTNKAGFEFQSGRRQEEGWRDGAREGGGWELMRDGEIEEGKEGGRDEGVNLRR